MLITLAIRNVLRNLTRLAPMMFSIALVFTVLILGNAVLGTTINALYEVYAERISGDLTVSSRAESNFTIFGSDQMLVGQFLTPPTLVDFPRLKEEARSWPEVKSTAGLVTAVARVDIEGKKRDSTVFGVDFESYREVISNLRLVAGDYPEPGQAGIVVQDHQWAEAEKNKGDSQGQDEDDSQDRFKKLLGKKALLASGSGRTFTLREVPVTGVVRYPVRDEMLDSIVLVDANTARALNGYLYGGEDQTFSPEEEEALTSDFSSLFGGDGGGGNEAGADGDAADPTESDAAPSNEALSNEESGIDPNNLFASETSDDDGEANGSPDPDSAQDPAAEPIELPDPIPGSSSQGAWNFLLVSLHDRGDADKVTGRFSSEGYTEDRGFLVRPWRSSVGGNAQIAWYLQVLFNVGLLFISFGAVIIAANALLLSILERTEEIGTLRAMGATRARVSVMITVETFLIVFGSALIGIFAGGFAVEGLNEAALIIDNRYIKLLFGGDPIRGELSVSMVAGHLLAAGVLTLLSMLYPLKRALEISPVEAMAE